MDNSIEIKHKKLVVFDLNLNWKISDVNEQESKNIALVLPLIRKASEYQTAVLTTNGSLVDAIDFMKDKTVDSGYIVASGGAVIYDMSKKEVIYKKPLDRNEIETTVHHGIMLGANVLIYTLTDKYIFVSNSVSYKIIQDRAYSPFKVIRSYDELRTVLELDDVVDIAYVNLVSPHKSLLENFNIYKWERYYDNEINDLQMKINKTSIFAHVAKKASTKLNGVLEVMLHADVTQLSDILYVAVTAINQQCFIKFKNCMIAKTDSIQEEIVKINKKRLYISDEINNLDDQLGLKTDSFWK